MPLNASKWLPRCNSLRVDVPTTYDFLPRFWRLSLPYQILLRGRSQNVEFSPLLSRLQDIRTVPQRQLRDALRAARKEKELDAKPNIVVEASRYADVLARNPGLSRTQVAEALGVSRIRVFQVLSILDLPNAILRSALDNDTPEYRSVLTERRLRPLTQLTEEADQLAAFRQLLSEAGV